MKTDGWGTFMMTGSVSDYLNYKLQETNGITPGEADGEKEGDKEHGAERCSYRYGVTDNADW